MWVALWPFIVKSKTDNLSWGPETNGTPPYVIRPLVEMLSNEDKFPHPDINDDMYFSNNVSCFIPEFQAPLAEMAKAYDYWAKA